MRRIQNILKFFTNSKPLKSNQRQALEKIIYQRKNLLIDAPPAWGKTVLIYGAAFFCLSENKTVILAFPFRQLASEKYEQIQKYYEIIKNYAGNFDMSILLGGDSPPIFQKSTNNLIFTTYEYLHFNLNNFKADLLCFDEAQTINQPNRNIYLIKTISHFTTHKQCRLILCGYKIPLYFSSLINPVEEIIINKKNHNILKYLPNHRNYKSMKILIEQILAENENNLILIFVATVKSTNSVSRKLNLDLLVSNNENICQPFNSVLSDSRKKNIINAIINHKIRCIVSTTSLTRGIDLPFSHVIIRDINIPGRRKLNQMEIEQISGRCGRGSKPGITYILHKKEAIPKQSPQLPNFEIFSIFLLSWLKINGKSSWEKLSKQIMSLDFFEKKFLSVNLYLQKLISSDLVESLDNTYKLTLTGERVLSGPFKINSLTRWQYFWKNADLNWFSFIDFLFAFSICFNSKLLLSSGNFQNCTSIFWNNWLKHEKYQIILNSFSLNIKNNKSFCLNHFNFACKAAKDKHLSEKNRILLKELLDLGNKKLIYPHNLEFWKKIEREYKYEKN